jgi:protein-disulfide isomerase
MRKAQAEAARRQARRRRIIWAIGGLVVLGLVVAIGVAVFQASQDDSPGAGGGDQTPANVTDGSVPVGQDDAPVTVAIYFDYMCPACGQFEEANGEELDRLLEAGEARVELRPISFLDQTSRGTQYSTRSANALATVADGAVEQAWDFHRALFTQQPQEGSTGFSDEEMVALAVEAGVPQEVADRFEDRSFEGWVEDVTQASFDAGIEGTPTVLIDEEEFTGDLYAPGALTAAVQAAGEGQEQ